jgi:hypothetical protein
MAQIWIDNLGNWMPVPLDGDVFRLITDPLRPQPVTRSAVAIGRDPLIYYSGATGNETWTLLIHPNSAIWVNGTPIRAGIRVLKHRDAIRWLGVGTMYFSTEHLARPEQFPGAEDSLHCPRCKLPIVQNQVVVKCPQCAVLHHQDQGLALLCWTYAEHCSLCDQFTDPAAGYRWTPEDL